MVTHATKDGTAPSILIIDDDLDTALFAKRFFVIGFQRRCGRFETSGNRTSSRTALQRPGW